MFQLQRQGASENDDVACEALSAAGAADSYWVRRRHGEGLLGGNAVGALIVGTLEGIYFQAQLLFESAAQKAAN